MAQESRGRGKHDDAAEPPAPPRPAAVARIVIDKPRDVVRAQFFDVDHAVRSRIYRGVRLSWLPRDASGVRRVRQEVRVLDRVQVEELVIEEGARGEWIRRHVDGPNEGTRFVATFHDDESPHATRVELEAWPGASGFALGLGKLSPLGLEKAMKKMLGEHKLALEGYEPGRARGQVVSVLASWGDLTAPMEKLDDAQCRAVVSLVLETACSMAAVDEPADTAERDAMHAVVSALWKVVLKEEAERRMIDAAASALSRDGVEARCDAIGAKLRMLGVSELGLATAILVAEVSRGLDARELSALRRLASAAGVRDERLAELVQRIDDDLAGPGRDRMSVFV
jgi:hypothetical protein